MASLVTVTVVDTSGLVRVVLRGDGASPLSLDTSRSKAYTLAVFAPISITKDRFLGMLLDGAMAPLRGRRPRKEDQASAN